MTVLQKFLLLHILTCLGHNGHGSKTVKWEKVPENSMLYMVSVQNKNGHVCAGFLVSESFVITAAHCEKEKPQRVVYGSHDIQESEKDVFIDMTYKFQTSNNNDESGDDIMVIELSRRVQPDKVQTIQLPASEMNIRENQLCRVAGWGKTKTGDVVNELRMVDVSIVHPQVCKYLWPGLSDDAICAGRFGTNKGFCQGDFGGPLVCNGIAVGVVSFNNKDACTYPDVPNVYTNISKHLDWINKIIGEAQIKNIKSKNPGPTSSFQGRCVVVSYSMSVTKKK